jgi:uncharacterized protein DUF433
MSGTPVFKGSRIPVDLVADMLALGATAEGILEGYPTLNKEMVSLAPLCDCAILRASSNRPLWRGKQPLGKRIFKLDGLEERHGTPAGPEHR